MLPFQPTPRKHLALFVSLLLLLLFVSPVADWLARSDLPWIAFYGLWAALILLAFLVARSGEDDER